MRRELRHGTTVHLGGVRRAAVVVTYKGKSAHRASRLLDDCTQYSPLVPCYVRRLRDYDNTIVGRWFKLSCYMVVSTVASERTLKLGVSLQISRRASQAVRA